MKIFELVCLSTGSESNNILLETDNDEMTEEEFKKLCKEVNDGLGGRAPITSIAGELMEKYGFREHKERVTGRYMVM